MDQEEQLAGFCGTLPELRQFARQQGISEVLDDVIGEIKAGTPVREQLPRLGIPKEALDGHRSSGPAMSMQGLGTTAHTAPEVYLCPDGRCGRTVPREPGGPVPGDCWLLGRPLRRSRA
ncbi:hypothetical protein [Amycolatopsis nigrescens]|uniref:hypothetical protein n=1 Tax=Amycolatopsis nigrescens TaxID=381445 RepID=UPI00036F7D7E|nr:hypothetical protein [Amycolatopsis nigrescens]